MNVFRKSISFAFDPQSVKTYHLLDDAGYYVMLELDVNYGYVLTYGLPRYLKKYDTTRNNHSLVHYHIRDKQDTHKSG